MTHLTGRVLTVTAQPVRNAFVEIWQVDSTASTCTRGAGSRVGTMRTFRATGAFSPTRRVNTTSAPSSRSLHAQGAFRTAHIHMAISRNGKRVFTSQLLVKGLPENAKDGIVTRLSADTLATL